MKYLILILCVSFISCKTTIDLTVFKQKSLDILNHIDSTDICQHDKAIILNTDSLPKTLYIRQGKNMGESCTIYQIMTAQDQDSIVKMGSLKNFKIQYYHEGKFRIGITYEPLIQHYTIGGCVFDRTVDIEVLNKEDPTYQLKITMLLPIGSFE
jgi:hypothetical protein